MFNDVDSALRWAAQMQAVGIYDPPSINGMCGKQRRSTDNELLIGLTPQQMQLQASLILRFISNVGGDDCKQYLLARYCKSDDIALLMSRVLSSGLLYSSGVNQRGIRKLVMQYLGRLNLSHRELREELRCANGSVNKFRDQVYTSLDGIHYRAISQVDNMMAEAGLIKSAGAA